MAAQPMSGIYEIVNLVNGKRYVGSAVDVAQRWRQHRRRLNSGTHHSAALQRAWLKYGAEAFLFRVLGTYRRDELLEREQAEFDRKRPSYNVCLIAGSTSGRRLSPSTRAKIAAKKAGTKLPERSAEHRAKLSIALQGRTKSPEHMAALQAGRKRQTFTDERRTRVSVALKAAYAEGRKLRERSPEYREKIAATLRGRKLTPEHRSAVAASMIGKKRGPYKRNA